MNGWEWMTELKLAVGNEFSLARDEVCVVADHRYAHTDVQVSLSAGARVRLLETTYDKDLRWQYHVLTVLDGHAAGSTVISKDVQGSFPWESDAETRLRYDLYHRTQMETSR